MIKNIDPATIFYADETGIDDNEVYEYGWAKKGIRLLAKKYGFKKKRLSIIATQNQNNITAVFFFESTCNADIFELYVEKVLVLVMKPGSTFIINNPSFHNKVGITAILEKIKCYLLYLSPYSPDLNPIEKAWSHIKHKIKKFLPESNRNFNIAAQKTFDLLLQIS